MTLLRSYSSGLDDLRPTLQLALDEGVELLRGATNDLGGLRSCDGRANRRHLQNLVEDAVNPGDQCGIHAGGPHDAVPNGDIKTGYRLPGWRGVRQLRHRPHRNAGKCPDLAFLDLAQRGRDRDDRGVGIVTQEGRQHFRTRTIDDVDLVDAGLVVEIGHEQMRPITQPGRGVVELARLLFRRSDEFGQCHMG